MDLFKFLSKVSSGDIHAFENLSDEDKKQFHPLVIQRWLSGTSDLRQILLLNEFSNKYLFSLDKETAFKLISASCTGSKKFSWIKGPASIKETLVLDTISSYYKISFKEAKMYRINLCDADILEMASELGYDNDKIKKLKAELKE